MISSRPYLIRALYDWIVDSDLTPYLLADATIEGVDVPAQGVKDDRIVLNLAPHAVQNIVLGNDAVSFSARFSGASRTVYLPVSAVLAVYAKENGHGMMFAADDEDSLSAGTDDLAGDSDKNDGPDGGPGRGKSHLKVVK
ncbi:MAG: ClpXP protease specificity-enhancing factor [Lysobacterales bacterium]